MDSILASQLHEIASQLQGFGLSLLLCHLEEDQVSSVCQFGQLLPANEPGKGAVCSYCLTVAICCIVAQQRQLRVQL